MRQGVGLIFLPQVKRLPQAMPCRDCFLCPITQASPYVLAKAFPEVRFFAPVLDFRNGYDHAGPALVPLAMQELHVSREQAERAWAAAVRAQQEAEQVLWDLGQQALEQAVAQGQPAILLAGHSYNAFTPEASLSVSKKLTSMGVRVIPADCLRPVAEGSTAWYFANQILNAVALARRHANLFLLCVSNFSCTIDAFSHAQLASEMGSKPYLILEIDAHAADAGIQTRLEAFLDIIHSYRETRREARLLQEAGLLSASGPEGRQEKFTPCRLATGGRVLRSNHESVPLHDPRVKLYFPNFSSYHAEAVGLAVRWLGLHPGHVLPLDRGQLDRGLRYTSGRECLPLPICIGQLLEIHEKRGPGEIAGFYMLRGGAACVADAYLGYLERFIAEQQLPDLFLLSPGEENDYCGFTASALSRNLSPAILVADILVEIEHVLHVAGVPGSVEQLRQQWQQLVAAAPSLEQFQAKLPGFIDRLAALPRMANPLDCPRVVVSGDFFTRFSPFFMAGVRDLYAAQGIILKPVDLSELFLYAMYHPVAEIAGSWGMKPGYLAAAKACTKLFQAEGKEYLQYWLAYQAESRSEGYYRKLFRKTGLLVAGRQDVSALFAKATEHVSPTIFGEVIPTVGGGLEAESKGYDGVLLIGPFNCLPFRISEAILRPLSLQRGMPILSCESDGYPVAPSFLRQVEVHIQQVLEHAARHRAGQQGVGSLAARVCSAGPT